MNPHTYNQLTHLSADFADQTGQTFQHFFCPILYVDDPTELVQGHIIPKCFGDSSGKTIVQRKDVDNCFGHFEAIFEQIQRADLTHQELLDDKKAGLLRPKLVSYGNEIQSYPYHPKQQVPEHHTLIGRIMDGSPVPWLVVKMLPDDFDALADHVISYIDADFRMPALISCLKAAHLTLFRLLGYRYVFNSAGFFLGRTVLGNYYDRVFHLQRGSDDFSTATNIHFAKYQNMVRPVEQLILPVDITGTITDQMLLVCWDDDDRPWAVQVFVRFGRHLNGVLVPSGESNYAKYNQMLDARGSFDLNVSVARFGGTMFEVDSQRFEIDWPKANLGTI